MTLPSLLVTYVDSRYRERASNRSPSDILWKSPNSTARNCHCSDLLDLTVRSYLIRGYCVGCCAFDMSFGPRTTGAMDGFLQRTFTKLIPIR